MNTAHGSARRLIRELVETLYRYVDDELDQIILPEERTLSKLVFHWPLFTVCCTSSTLAGPASQECERIEEMY